MHCYLQNKEVQGWYDVDLADAPRSSLDTDTDATKEGPFAARSATSFYQVSDEERQ
jgi:hypothetical protein